MYINKNLEDIIVSSNTTLKDSLSVLNNGGIQALLVVDTKEFKGIVTDGDIRRHLLKDGDLDALIESVIKKESTISLTDMIMSWKEYLKKKINHIPILNKKNQIVSLAMRTDFNNKNYENTNSSIVPMAGGKGSRLAIQILFQNHLFRLDTPPSLKKFLILSLIKGLTTKINN